MTSCTNLFRKLKKLIPTGNGKVDINIRCNEKKGIIEVKSFVDMSETRKGTEQAAAYARSLNLITLFLILYRGDYCSVNRSIRNNSAKPNETLPIPNAIGSHPGTAAPQCGTCFSRHKSVVIIAALGCGDPRNNDQYLQLGTTPYFVTTKQVFPLVEKAGLYSISTDKRVIPSASRRPGIWILKSSEYVDSSFTHSGL